MNLEARGIVVTRKDDRGGQRRVLDGATFTLHERTVASLEGASGSGKTTLLRVMASLCEPDEGAVLLGGVDAKTLAPRVFRRRVAYVLQQPPMLEGSVADNVACGPRLAGAPLADAAIALLLERVGLDPAMAARSARELSGGEKQRVAFARALANDPEIMLLDEPTAALDAAAATRIVELVRGLVANGLSILVVTHIEEHARALGGERFECVEGRVVPRRAAS